MVAYSFKPRFAEPIIAGTKGGTVRKDRGGSGHAKPGDMLQLYTGMRTKRCRMIDARTCVAVVPITLSFGMFNIEHVRLDNAAFAIHEAQRLDAFACFDGFADWGDLKRFWRDEHGEEDQFYGWHIRWLDLPEALR